MIELFSTLDERPEPPLPAGLIEQTLATAQKSARRRRVAQAVALALTALLLGVTAIGLPGRLIVDRPLDAEHVVLPDRIAGHRLFTAKVSAHPGGTGLLLFWSGNSEKYLDYQVLVLGADGRTYRQVDALRTDSLTIHQQALLAPDGNSLLIADRGAVENDLLVVDLRTGKTRRLSLPLPAVVALLAWSPDGRYVAISRMTPDPDLRVDEYERRLADVGVLAVLDLSTGGDVLREKVQPARAAAFAPDGRRLAVQSGTEIRLIALDGARLGQVRAPATNLGIVPGVAWSPDGQLLALVPYDDIFGAARPTVRAGTISFAAATDRAEKVPDPVPAQQLLGWTGSRTLLVMDYSQATLTEVSLEGGGVRPLSAFESDNSCEMWTQPCLVEQVQVASGLLGSLTVEPAKSPQWGPWPWGLQVLAALLLAGVALFGYRMSRRLRRRATHRPSS